MSPNEVVFDLALIDRVRRTGDSESKERLGGQIRTWLRHGATFLRLDAAFRQRLSASDVTQDACLEVWIALPRFRGHTDAEFKAFLRAALFHTFADARDFQRRQARNPGREQPIESNKSDSQLKTPSAIVSRREQTLIANSFIDGLPEVTRTIIHMKHREDLGWSQIAAEVGLAVGAVKMRYRRAMQEIRAFMEE